MAAQTFRISRSFKVIGFGADATARFFSLPSQSMFTVVAESAISGCIQIMYEGELYVTFKRNLMSHLERETDLSGSAG